MSTSHPPIPYSTIIIAGLGREGYSSYRYLAEKYSKAKFILSDALKPKELDPVLWGKVWDQPRVTYVPLTEITLPDQTKADTVLLCKTPGIPRENPQISQILEQGAKLTSNNQLFVEELSQLPSIQTIGITGTKGKSTTSSLIASVLRQTASPVFLLGNIGQPPLDELEEIKRAATAHPDSTPVLVVLEFSSHQLRELSISPYIAVLLDVTPEHLDYYPNFEAYWQAKSNVARFQKSKDFLLFDPSQKIPFQIAQLSLAQKIPFGNAATLINPLSETVSAQVWFDQTHLYYHNERILAREQLPILGEHNARNSLPAIWIGKQFGLSTGQIAEAIIRFQPLPHRLQQVGSHLGVSYINDSQATTPESSIAAISSFPGKEIILLAGGSDKGVTFTQLAEKILHSQVTTVVLFPPMGAIIQQEIEAKAKQLHKKAPTMQTAHSMPEAVEIAAAAAKPGNVVLLSPACASFGLFKNYQDRGNQFIKYVVEMSSK